MCLSYEQEQGLCSNSLVCMTALPLTAWVILGKLLAFMLLFIHLAIIVRMKLENAHKRFKETLVVGMLVCECYSYLLSKYLVVYFTSWVWSNNAIQESCKFLLAIPIRTAKTLNQVLHINPCKLLKHQTISFRVMRGI